MNIARNAANHWLLTFVLFFFFSVVSLESVAKGDLLYAPISAAGNAARQVIRERYATNLHHPQGSRLLGDNLASPGAFDDVMVVGRIADTTKFAGEAGHQVLKVPRQSPTWMWNIDVNDGWMHRGIAEGRKFLLATKPSMSSLRSVRTLDDGTVVRDFTVYFRELKMLRNAGYVQRKMPNGQIMMVPGS